MSSLKELRWGKHPAPVAEAGRRLAAALLQSASALLARLAAGLASEPREYPFIGSQIYTTDELLDAIADVQSA